VTEQASTGDRVCDDCGQNNPVWFAPVALWNRVVGGPEAKGDPGGVLCPICFIRRAEGAGVRPTAWIVQPEEGPRPPTLDALTRAHIGRVLASKGMGDFGVRQSLEEIEAILGALP
jgi:hypothetical protein